MSYFKCPNCEEHVFEDNFGKDMCIWCEESEKEWKFIKRSNFILDLVKWFVFIALVFFVVVIFV